jgi:hypothetical protein
MSRSSRLVMSVLAVAVVSGWTPVLAAPDDTGRPAPDASPGRDRRSVASTDEGTTIRPGEPARVDDATGAEALHQLPSATGPTGNDTGTKGTERGTGATR